MPSITCALISLDCHTRTNAGSFQRVSAGAGHSCHRFRLHDRRASCPFSGAVRRSRLPGIVSLHSHLPHGGRDPPPSLWAGFQPCSVGARYYPPRCRAVEKEAQRYTPPRLSLSHSSMRPRCKNAVFQKFFIGTVTALSDNPG